MNHEIPEETAIPVARAPGRWEILFEILLVALTGFLVIPLVASSLGYDPQLFLRSLPAFASFLTLEATLTLGIVWLLLRRRNQGFDYFRRRTAIAFHEILIGLAVTPFLFLLVAGVSAVFQAFFPHWVTLENPLLRLVRTPSDVLLLVLTSVYVGGFKEEIQRAFVLERFRENLGGAGLGLVLWSAFFGYGHALQGVDNAVATGLLGLVFGALYLWRGSLCAPITAHAAFNTLTTLFYWFLGPGP
ncbi:MAG: hypothetical protein Kow00109_26700 [Acidobacteriota bacterium]